MFAPMVPAFEVPACYSAPLAPLPSEATARESIKKVAELLAEPSVSEPAGRLNKKRSRSESGHAEDPAHGLRERRARKVLKRSLKCSNLQKLDEIATQLEHGTPLHLVVERQLAGGGKPPRLPSPAKPKTAQVSDGEESDTPDWFPLEA